MKNIKFKIQIFIFALFCLSPVKASASTYQDVTNFLNANPAPSGCMNWVEEVEGGYKVWRRCNSTNILANYSITCKNGYEYTYTNPTSAYACDGSGGRNLVSGLYIIYRGYATSERTDTYCQGTTYTYSSGVCGQVGDSDPCLSYNQPYTNCRSYDTSLADFPILDQCLNKLTNTYESCFQNCKDPVDKAGQTIAEICSDGIDNNCDGQIDEGCGVCTDGTTRACYSGREGTEGKGMCRAGTQTCANGQWGSCTGEVIPEEKEQCDNKDHNCNGQVAETCNGPFCQIPMGSTAHPGSGNLYHSQDVFSVQRGVTLTISYNSLDAAIGPLGKGWTHNYDLTITSNSDESLGLKQGDGNIIYFRQNGGIYYPENRSGDHSFIVKNSDGTYTQTTKEGIIYSFNSSGKLISIKDRNGNATTLTYTGNDITSITDATGRVAQITISSGKITSITTPDNKIYNLIYTGSLLSTITDPQNNNYQYTYDTNGKMLTKIDPNGNTALYTYDAEGRITASTDPEGKTKSIAYPAADDTSQTKTTTVTEKDGGNWQYTYDIQNGTLSNKTDPQNNTTFYTYDGNRNMLSKIDPDESATTYTYDDSGNMTSTTDPLNQTTTYTYNQYGQITSTTDPSGNITSYEYDANGNLTKTTDPIGAITQYQYDTKGNIIQITNASGQTTTLAYDQQNNLTSITDTTGATTSFTYDASGNMTTQTDANGNITRFEYNSLNQLIKITDPQGNITVFAYDANGNRISQTDANGNITKYEYNYKGQLIKVTDALNNITIYAHGGTGCATCGSGGDNLTSITDAKGNVTKYEYDTNGRLIKETDTLGNAIAYSYDAKGNLVSKTDAKGSTITYTYDSLNRLLKKTYPDTITETYTYDSKGNIITAGNQYISYTFSYDANNRVRSVTDSNSRTINYEYNTLGNKTKLTYPDGATVSYTYDNANRLGSIINGGGRTYSYQYDNLGRRTKLTMPNGTYATYAYDNSGRLNNLSHKTSTGSTIDSFTYTHDKIGNRLTKATPGNTATYVYDNIYRLLNSTYSNSGPTKLQNDVFTYDPVGNRLTSSPNRTYAYNNANQLLNYKGQAYLYDKNGNLTIKTDEDYDLDTEIEGWTYQYDFENRLIKITKNEKNETKTMTFKYDPFGRRIEKKIEGVDKGIAETNTYTYVYDNEDIILEYNTKITSGLTTQETSKYIHGPGIDEPLALEKAGNIYYYHADGLGSITGLTDTTGKVVQAYEYDAFGDLHDNMNAIKQPYTYTGREWDRETGLYYYRNRYDEPKIGRFTTRDPSLYLRGSPEIPYLLPSLLVTPQELNPYLYSQNNPQTLTDPYGLSVMLCQRQAFLDDWGKENPFYIVPHCYIVAGSNIFSWNIQAGGGIHGYEKPGNNVCSLVKCCGDESAFENCVITEATAEKGKEGNLWIPTLHDCCTWAHKIVGKCRQRHCR